MRVTCKCGHKGRIASREALSVDFAKLYCQCLDATCGHTWVANLTFSHTLSPSAQTFERMLYDRLRELPRTQQRELFDRLGMQPVI
ncbi:transcriptional regulator [Pseudomonas sp. BCA14]|uniref:ogr/Delta-like zinc finger family protein n=1 Tax=unclassified Pseudomonas TaxID=196821 RepID=UPI00106EA90F|nr:MULTISPECIES: ogr/Delta-like zinc finger family protein [unclassified Pseudomonas]TFF13049.1 transcriptional regulator [Pseudomonas sp. JMN1]TFF16268.1 transcriptional regulator [Pseudomonas sp. BCA17]TFF30205.1 transcriptional regulator [Pseudomonas sp. BCA13]TFF31046.1 transcriptional regulator [Pseudomonas sp. BCA14]